MTGWWRAAFGGPGIRALGLAWFASLVATFSVTVATLVLAYGEGGAALVAYFGLASTAPGAVLSPLLMGRAARAGSGVVLRRTTVARAALLALAAMAAALDLAGVLVVTLAALAVALGSTFRPTQASLLPWLARSPGELTAANVAATVAENSAALAGPLLAGALLAWADAATTMAAAAVFMGLSVVALLGLRVPDEARPSPAQQRGDGLAREIGAGARALARVAPPAGVVVLALAQTFVRGALMVVLIVLALETLGLGESSIGWLNAAVGLGGLAGAVVASRTLRISRLGRCFLAGVLLWGLGLLALAAAPGFLVAFVTVAVVGTGNALLDASGFTLLPREVGPRLAGPALGFFEVVVLVGLGGGALAAPLLADLLGTRQALAGLGGALCVVTLLWVAPFLRLDAATRGRPALGEVLRSVPIFAPLPLVVLEDLADRLVERRFEPGARVVVEGAPGDDYHLVTAGAASVDVHGVPRRTLGPGDGFGEIALLRDVPRTATVTADTALTTLTLERDAFLAAVTGNVASRTRAEAVADDRLAEDPGTDPLA